jgi:plasmid stabilization system protein ParE
VSALQRYVVRTSPSLEDRVIKGCRYIARNNPAKAAEIVESVLEAIADLDHLPYRFGAIAIRGLRDGQTRQRYVHPFRITYRIDEARKQVNVLYVRHFARKPL